MSEKGRKCFPWKYYYVGSVAERIAAACKEFFEIPDLAGNGKAMKLAVTVLLPWVSSRIGGRYGTLEYSKKEYTFDDLKREMSDYGKPYEDDKNTIGFRANAAFRCARKRGKVTEAWACDDLYYKITELIGEFEKIVKKPVKEMTLEDQRCAPIEFPLKKDIALVAPTKIIEGGNRTVTLTKYERNPEARAKCLEYWGYNCQGCGVNIKKRYRLSKECIQVHHLVMISRRKEEYIIDPVRDLIPLCPNCHCVVHLRNPPFSLEDLQKYANNGLFKGKIRN